MTAAIWYMIMMISIIIGLILMLVVDYIDSHKKKKFTWFDYEWSLDKHGNIIVHWDKLRHDIQWYKDMNYDMESLDV